MKQALAYSRVCLAGGTALIGWALFAPLATLPVVGSVRFSEAHLGGKTLAWVIVFLLAISWLLLTMSPLKRLGFFLGGTGFGVAGASLIALYRSTIEQVQQFAEAGGQSAADVEKLLAGLQFGSGLTAFLAGAILWLIGLVFLPQPRREHQPL